MNRKGLNNIVVTILLVLLVIAGAGIFWGFIANTLSDSADSFQRGVDSLSPNNRELDLIGDTENIAANSIENDSIPLSGIVEVLHYDYFSEDGSSNFFYLNNGQGKYWMNLSLSQMSGLYAGLEIMVNGTVQLNNISGLRYINVNDIEITENYSAPDSSNMGEKKIAYILVNFDFDSREVFSGQDAVAIMQDASAYFNNISNGQLSYIQDSGDVYGWYTLETCDACASGLQRVIDMADSDIDYEEYDKIVMIYPSGADYVPNGQNYIGKFNNEDTSELFKIAISTINSEENIWSNENLDYIKKILRHELTHLLYNNVENHHLIYHASGYECGSLSLSLDCFEAEYADYHEVLGLEQVGIIGLGFNSVLREKVGWLRPQQIHNYQAPGIYTLIALESNVPGIKAIKIPFSFQNISGNLHLEYNSQTANPGLVFHLDCISEFNCKSAYTETLLIDATPDSLAMDLDFADSALPLDLSFYDLFNNLTINILEINSSSIRISIGENILCGNLNVESQEECDDGNNINGDGCSLDCKLEPDNGIYYRVFVTSQTFNGNLGGLSGANTLCNLAADNVNIQGLYGNHTRFKAWISTSSQSASSHLYHAYKRYKLMDGTLVALNWNDLTDGFLINSIYLTELNSELNSGRVWTGTFTNSSSASSHCNNWLSSSQSNQGYAGFITRTNSGWTEGTANCNTQAHLYCIEQPVCGNGLSETASEWCDDGNNINGDGCSSNCRIENNNPQGDGQQCTNIQDCINPPKEFTFDNGLQGNIA